MCNGPNKTLQNGAATILVAVVLLIAITLATFFAARVNIEEQRISANDYRAKEAFNAADAGLDHVMMRLESSSLLPVTLTETLNNGASYDVTVTDVGTSWLAESIGTSADGTGTATVRQNLDFYSLFGDGVDAPLTVAGTAGISGSMEVVANPNGAGPGVPISIWSSDNITFGSNSSSTCNLDEYLAAGSPDDELLCDPTDCGCDFDSISSESQGKQYDIVDNDPSFPTDLFLHTFNVAHEDWQVVKDLAASSGGVLESCDDLGPDASGLYWIDGECQIAANMVVGSLANPVILVVDGNLRLQGGAALFGVAYAFNNPDDADPDGGTIQINGSNIVYGSVISDHDIDISSGTFHVRYDGRVINNIINGDEFQVLAKVANSWRDFE